MLRILTDAHISRSVATQVRAHRPRSRIESIHDWQGGRHRDESDPKILAMAAEHGLTLLTHDQRTIMLELGRSQANDPAHAGAGFVDERTIGQMDIGCLVRAITELRDNEHDAGWTNRIAYLPRPEQGRRLLKGPDLGHEITLLPPRPSACVGANCTTC